MNKYDMDYVCDDVERTFHSEISERVAGPTPVPGFASPFENPMQEGIRNSCICCSDSRPRNQNTKSEAVESLSVLDMARNEIWSQG